MSNPYINTSFKTQVRLRPDQLNNDIVLNIKNNLVTKLEGKCFRDHGYIVKIFSVENYSDGYVSSDNSYSPIVYNVTFNCRLCYVANGTQIVCQIEKITEELIRLINGPMRIFVTSDRLNKSIFFIDNNSNIRLKDGSKKLTNSDFVKVTIKSSVFEHGNSSIVCLGFIDDIATNEEIKEHYDNIYDANQT